MKSANLEEQVIQKTNRILVIRVVCLSIFIITQLSTYFKVTASYEVIQTALLVISALIWGITYIRHIYEMIKASKNTYLKQAFKDDYIKMIEYKSCYYGFVAMLLIANIILLFAFILHSNDLSILIPIEAILFSGIIISDVSNIILIRR